jgi:serine/threonine kinase 16
VLFNLFSGVLASQHTTISYRPPELFDGGLQLPYNSNSTNQLVLDYCAVDVWSLGCTLHAIMYGASPFECEFVVSSNINSGIKIVDCTHLSIIGNIPTPKYAPISL